MTGHPRLRRFVFRFVAVVLVPVMVLGMAELGLRIFGYGFNPSPIVAYRWDGRPAFSDNFRYPWRFFSPQISRDFDPFIFLSPKPAKTFRIFIIGSSAAQGVPDGAFSFGRQLSVMLREAFPSWNFEIVNAALTAVNSHAALPLARQCASREVDLIIVYMGNNEVVGPYGPGTVFSPFFPRLALIRLNIALKTLRLGQFMDSLLGPADSGKGALRTWRGMEMFLQRQIAADDARLSSVNRHFGRNVEDLCRAVLRKKGRVILCTVAVNLKDCPPFASQDNTDPEDGSRENWEALHRRGVEMENAGEDAKALKFYREAAAIDDGRADLHFRMGRSALRLGDIEQARLSFTRARDFDTLRFRADSGINRRLREAAAVLEGRGVFLADVEKAFADASADGIPGRELFLDHVHMTFDGNFLIARTLFDRIKSLLPEEATGGSGIEMNPPGPEICAERLAFTDWDRHQVLDEMLNAYFRKPPFTNQLDNPMEIARMEKELEALRFGLTQDTLLSSAAQYDRAIALSPKDWWLRWKYAQLLDLGRDRPREALAQYEAMTQLIPHSFLGYSGMGYIQHRLKDAEAAIDSCLRALAIAPTKAEVHNTLASAYMIQGDGDKAETHFRKALVLQPHYTAAYTNLAILYSMNGRLPEAVQVCREGLVFEPDSTELILALAEHLVGMGSREEAVVEIRKALKKHPRNEELNRKLNELLWEKVSGR